METSRSNESLHSGRIGARIEEVRQELLSCGEALVRLVEPQARPMIGEAQNELRNLACRMAIVGQIKSGKSSFINALVRQPGLLPTSVTPWTTAVTHLNFGQAPPDGYRAVFAFLQRAEWDALAAGDSRLRELTARLVPGFAPDLLEHQARLLRRRAEERLGPEFEALLGQAHFFETLAPGTLEHYVCSGEFAGPHAIGKYSDITKSADIYLSGGPFAFPCTVIDTPGTNDPFLIRDEITRLSLGSADVYIVVLTAAQPLSDTDVALLRIMRGLNRDRIVVLINRIDDLADVDRELPEVTAYVESRLANEFPGSRIPVVTGSAWWALQAMAFDPEAAQRILKRRSANYLLRAGLLAPQEITPASLASPDFRERMRQSLLALSGLPAVHQAVEALLTTSRPVFTLRQITRSFAEMSRACETAARSELQILLATRSEENEPKPPTDKKAAIYARERDLLVGVAGDIEASATGIEAQLARIIQEEKESLRRALKVTIDYHAARERDVLIDTLSRGRPPRVWTHEGVELRRALANEFAHRFEQSAHRLTSFHARVVPELHRLVHTLVPEPDLTTPRSERLTIPTPNIAPLSRLLMLDLDTPRWNSFWSRQPAADSSGAKIEALIQAEFAPIADELTQTAANAFQAFGANTIRWSFAACRNIQLALKRRLELVLADFAEIQRAAAASEPPRVPNGLDGRIQTQTQRLADNETLTRHLDNLVQYIDGILRGEAPRSHGSNS